MLRSCQESPSPLSTLRLLRSGRTGGYLALWQSRFTLGRNTISHNSLWQEARLPTGPPAFGNLAFWHSRLSVEAHYGVGRSFWVPLNKGANSRAVSSLAEAGQAPMARCIRSLAGSKIIVCNV